MDQEERDQDGQDGQAPEPASNVYKVGMAAFLTALVGIGVLSWGRREADVQRIREQFSGVSTEGGMHGGEIAGYLILGLAVLLALAAVVGYATRD